MNFHRVSYIPGREGYPPNEDRWDDRNPMSNTPAILGSTAYFYYRGTGNTGGGAKIPGEIGVMTAPANDVRRDTMTWPAASSYGPASLHYSGPDLGMEWGDMHAIAVGTTIYLFVNVEDKDDTGGNPGRTAVLSTDGTTLTHLGEVRDVGDTRLPDNIAAVYHDGTYFWLLVSQSSTVPGTLKGKRLLYGATAAGIYADGGDAMMPTGVAGDWHRYTLITGRGWQDATYAYALIPGGGHSGDDVDWPEAHGLWRCPLASLGTPAAWEVYHDNPVFLRGPDDGGSWQLSYLPGLTGMTLYQAWGLWGSDNVGSTAMLDCRDTMYNGGHKDMKLVRATSQLAMTDWDFEPLPDATYRIKHFRSGKYMTAAAVTAGSNVTAETTPTGLSRWVMSRAHGFRVLALESAPTMQLRMRDDGRGETKHAEVNVSGGAGYLDMSGEWLCAHWMQPKSDTSALCTIQNRYSSLGLVVDAVGNVEQQTIFDGPDAVWRFERVID